MPMNEHKYVGKYIYKITNTINNKVYIGQTVNIEKRFKQHIRASQNKTCEEYNNLLYNAFRKYGIDNFTIENMGFYEDYNEKEKEFIALFNSNNPQYGYNILEGGENPPVGVGGNKIYDDEVIDGVITDLLHTNLSYTEIANKYNIHYNSVRQINDGTRRPRENISYPIRKVNTYKELEDKALLIIDDLLNTNLTQKEIAKKHGVARSCVTMINIGKNHRQPHLQYPIRWYNL